MTSEPSAKSTDRLLPVTSDEETVDLVNLLENQCEKVGGDPFNYDTRNLVYQDMYARVLLLEIEDSFAGWKKNLQDFISEKGLSTSRTPDYILQTEAAYGKIHIGYVDNNGCIQEYLDSL